MKKIVLVTGVCLGVMTGVLAYANDFETLSWPFGAPAVEDHTTTPVSPSQGDIVFDDDGANGGEFLGYSGSVGGWLSLTSAADVESDHSSVIKVEAVKVTTNGVTSCTTSLETGNWVTGTTANGVGDCTLTMTGFSAQPVCTLTIASTGTANVQAYVKKDTVPTSTTLRIQLTQPAAVDGDVYVHCIGPKS